MPDLTSAPTPQPAEAPPKVTPPPPNMTPPIPKPAPMHPPSATPRPTTALPPRVAAPIAAPIPVVSAPVATTPEPPAPAPHISPDWRRSLGAWIGANRVYPEDARRNGDQGTVAVRLTVDRLGHVTSVELARSSGAALLDATSLAMLKNGSLPPFPPEMTQDSLTITVQVHYALAN